MEAESDGVEWRATVSQHTAVPVTKEYILT